MNKVYMLVAGVAFATASAVGAAGLGTKIAGDEQGWKIMQSKDSMTDKPGCVAIYKGDATIQAAQTYFYVGARGKGGVSAYQIRVNDDTAGSLQLATDIEKKISAVNLGPSMASSIFDGRTKRLRVRVSTILNSSFDVDIDTASLVQYKDLLSGPQCN